MSALQPIRIAARLAAVLGLTLAAFGAGSLRRFDGGRLRRPSSGPLGAD